MQGKNLPHGKHGGAAKGEFVRLTDAVCSSLCKILGLIVVVDKGFSGRLPPKLHVLHLSCAVHGADAAAPFPRAASGVCYFACAELGELQ